MRIAAVVSLITLAGCSSRPSGQLFELMPPEHTRITFENTLGYDYDFNVYRYRNFYNGGGVALGDVNQDGRPDVFFTGNQTANRLYLNNGDFTFTDISDKAGIKGSRAWSTGVSMADINGDGRLDIYVCNSGIVKGDDKRNELYINQGDSTFLEMAADFGLDDAGLSTHATFLDYDRDGDVDLYLVNNSYRNIGSFDIEVNTRHIPHFAGGDRLYRNDGARFTDVTLDAGIYSSEIGFGLGASTGDVNRDGWPDLYISNDFFERDYLYLNNADGTFSESLESSILSVSAAAMGADMADINSDGWPDIFVTDMLPPSEQRLKTVSSFDSWSRYQNYVRDGYYHQFTRNTLHLGRGTVKADPRPTFSESGRMLGVEASDWSWGALIADFDLDGQRDIFVANGIYRDLTNADYLVEIRQEATMDALTDQNYVDWKTLIDMIPSEPIANHMFARGQGGGFADVTADWGLNAPVFSNGSAYGDMDRDGDLDLIVSNINMPPIIYQNRASRQSPHRHWLQLNLQGRPPNTQAVGAAVSLWHQGRLWYQEQYPVRGFQSSVDPLLHFGLGSAGPAVDSVVVVWPGGGVTRLTNVTTRQILMVSESESAPAQQTAPPSADTTLFTAVDPADFGLAWHHVEQPFNDFDQQPLLFHMRSTEGPALCAGDYNGDKHADLYLGGARDQAGALYVQTMSGQFAASAQSVLDSDAVSEDVDCAWFDADSDGDEDLYVASGSSEFPASSSALVDRLYINTPNGLVKSEQILTLAATMGFAPTAAVRPMDFDHDGDVDLFIGSRLRPFAYGLPADSYLLINDGSGQFTEASSRLAPEFSELGLLTDARWVDVDQDGWQDLMIVGEWMPITLFKNNAGVLNHHPAGLEEAIGWWQRILPADLDGDGDMDFIAGNHGLNSRFKAPVDLWVSDFDRNGRVEQIFARTVDGQLFPWHLRHDLVGQLPHLVRTFPTYASYAGRTIHEIFPAEAVEQAHHLRATELRSMAGFNDGSGRFTLQPLPFEAQLAPMYGLAAVTRESAGEPLILMGGNLYEVKPEAGRYDASYGTVMQAPALTTVAWQTSGFVLRGQVRRLLPITAGNRNLVVAALNNDQLHLFAYDR
ncbi:MAG: FG-GAP-like repeat-containing protein [Bacteroidota bacterium]|nr:FG-GAP-like repeat-containing protein [Bacteroidota bacterium]